MENPNLRLSRKIGRNEQGVLITEVKPNYPESEILRPYDIILSIDGITIANDGTGNSIFFPFIYVFFGSKNSYFWIYSSFVFLMTNRTYFAGSSD